MRLPRPRFTPDWLLTYTGVMLLLGVAVNWARDLPSSPTV